MSCASNKDLIAFQFTALMRRRPCVREKPRNRAFQDAVMERHFTESVWLQHFRMSWAIVHQCLYAVCTSIKEQLMRHYFRLPNVARANEIAYRNFWAHLVPQIYDALDGMHIPILSPKDDYF